MKLPLLLVLVIVLVIEPASAIKRSPYPAKPAPPYRGDIIVIGDNRRVC
jgi:hypothetical protein